MSPSWQSHDALVDLLIKEATEGLTPAEAAELANLSRPLSSAERASLESTVAAIALAGGDFQEKMPAALRDRIVNAAVPSGRRRSWNRSNTGWWAAAACLILAVAGWWPRLFEKEPMDPAQQRAELMSSGRALEASWINGPAMGGQPVIGDVVFDPVSQRGVLRFRGIPANDPRRAQYQLWIADAGRGQPEPVDGGVFDITESGDVIIPFQAKLPVDKPAAFVVTLEQPGGVVVSKQEHVMALAKVGAGA